MKFGPFEIGLSRKSIAPVAVTERVVTVKQLADVLDGHILGYRTVNDRTIVETAAVLACLRVHAYGVAVPNLMVSRERSDGRGSEPARNEPIYKVLAKQPNPWQTSFEWRAMMQICASLYGNAYSIKTIVKGQIVELIPLDPSRMTVTQNQDFSLVYQYTQADGSRVTIPQNMLFHLRGLSIDGYRGLDSVRLARKAVSLAMGLEELQNDLSENGGRPSGILSTDQDVNDKTLARLRDEFQAKFSQGGQGGIAILDKGYKFTEISMSSVDMQHLETRRFQIEEICRIFNVFPQMVMQTDKTSTFASAEAFFAASDEKTILPLKVNWAQAIDRDILDKDGPLQCQFVDAFLKRVAPKDLGLIIRTFVETGTLTRNEVREQLGYVPLDGLDEPLTPLNMGLGDGQDTSNDPNAGA